MIKLDGKEIEVEKIDSVANVFIEQDLYNLITKSQELLKWHYINIQLVTGEHIRQTFFSQEQADERFAEILDVVYRKVL
jgi:hypothetical protein